MNHSVSQKFSTCCHEANIFYLKCITLTHCNKHSLSMHSCSNPKAVLLDIMVKCDRISWNFFEIPLSKLIALEVNLSSPPYHHWTLPIRPHPLSSPEHAALYQLLWPPVAMGHSHVRLGEHSPGPATLNLLTDFVLSSSELLAMDWFYLVYGDCHTKR